MATAEAQRKWRDKHWFVKRQLNVTVRRLVHEYLEEIAAAFRWRGKGQAVAFNAFVTRSLMQRADYDAETARMLDDFAEIFRRDGDLYS